MRMTYRILFAAGLLAVVHACGGTEAPREADTSSPAGSGSLGSIGGGQATLVHEGQGGSPHVRVGWSVDGANISITYGRPYLKGRVVGENVEPFPESVWRLGADEATTLASDRDLMFRDTHVPAGEYTLWTAYVDAALHLVVNRQLGQWGTDYDPGADLARVRMDVTTAATPAEQLTLAIGDRLLRIEWGTLVATVPIMVH